jgi:hypothetical protein
MASDSYEHARILVNFFKYHPNVGVHVETLVPRETAVKGMYFEERVRRIFKKNVTS